VTGRWQKGVPVSKQDRKPDRSKFRKTLEKKDALPKQSGGSGLVTKNKGGQPGSWGTADFGSVCDENGAQSAQ